MEFFLYTNMYAMVPSQKLWENVGLTQYNYAAKT